MNLLATAPGSDKKMRLDLFLKASRLVLRRSLAQELCDAGYVKVNDFPAKSAKDIKAGDAVEIRRRNRILTVKVRQIPGNKQVSRNDAASFYEVVSEGVLADISLESPFESEDSSKSPAP
jgi:ribosomal 50S subunit-recycling heat shock protein